MAELCDDDCCADFFELLAPVALLAPAGGTGFGLDAALGGGAFGIEVFDVAAIAPLFEDGVALPAEVADSDFQFRFGSDEAGLKVAVEAGALDVGRAGKGDDVVGFEFEGLGRDEAGTACQEENGKEAHGRDELFLRWQFFDDEVFVADDGGGVAVDLDGDDAGGGDVGFGFGVVDGLDAVEPDLDVLAFSANAVVVPFADGFLGFGEDFGGGLGEDLFAAAFVVEGAVVAFAEVGLIAGDFVVIGDALGAKLDAAVDEAFGAFELPFEGEFEVAVGFGGGEEVVFFLLGGEGAGNEGAVFDAPDSSGVAFPAGEGFAVEEGDWVGAGGEGQGEKQQRCVVKTGHGKESD